MLKKKMNLQFKKKKRKSAILKKKMLPIRGIEPGSSCQKSRTFPFDHFDVT